MLQHNPARRPAMRQVEQALAIAAAGGVAPAASGLVANPSQLTQQLTLASTPPVKPAPPGPTQLPSPARPPLPSTSDPPSAVSPAPRRRTRGLLIAAVLAIVLVLTGAIIALITTLHGGGGATGSSRTPAPPVAARSATTGAASTRAAAPPTVLSGPSGSAASTAPAAPPPTASSPSSSPLPSAPPAGAAPSTPVEAITSYYNLVPTDLSDAWARLTPSYQQTSGGIGTYQQFWNTIAEVTATDVAQQNDGTVQATITYLYKNGQVVHERTIFGVVNDDGQLKINSTRGLHGNAQ
jgi:hypothetical protein